MTADPDELRWRMNEFFAPLAGGTDLSAAAASRLVEALIDGQAFSYTVAEFFEALTATVSVGRLPAQTVQLMRGRSQAQLLEFVRLVADLLERRKPWPGPRFVKLDPARWADLARTRPIARINQSANDISWAVDQSFDHVRAGDQTLPVMILQLRSGATVALLGTPDPACTDFTLRLFGPEDPDAVVEEFRALAGYAAGEVTPI